MKKINLTHAQSFCDPATPGPWFVPDDGRLQGSISAMIDGHARQVAAADGQAPQFDKRANAALIMYSNARFIAYAREALPDAIIEIRTLRAALLEACAIAYDAIEENAAAMPTTRSCRIDELRKLAEEP